MDMRFLIVLLFVAFIDYYAFQALKTMGQDWSTVAQRWLTITYWSITGLFLLFLFLSNTSVFQGMSKNTFNTIRSVFFLIYFAKFGMASILLVGDIITFISGKAQQLATGKPMNPGRSKFLGQFAVIVSAIPFLALINGLKNVYRYKVRRIKVTLDNLPAALKGLKIVQISDIHSGSLDDKTKILRGIDLINKEEADLVFFTGDLVNTQTDEAFPFIDTFSKIKAKHGVYSVLGNHDYGDYRGWNTPEDKKENFQQMIDTHAKMGWNLLLNRHEVVTINDQKVGVIGVENISAMGRFHSYGDLKKACEGMDAVDLKLLLSHDPTHWDDETTNAEFKDISITFSGHTHGSQFGLNIPGFIKWSPVKWVYKRWAGLYQKEQQYLYVNVGFGVLAYPGRVGFLPEITVMELA